MLEEIPNTWKQGRRDDTARNELVRTLREAVNRLSIMTPYRRAKLTPLSGTVEVVPVANRGDPRGFV